MDSFKKDFFTNNLQRRAKGVALQIVILICYILQTEDERNTANTAKNDITTQPGEHDHITIAKTTFSGQVKGEFYDKVAMTTT